MARGKLLFSGCFSGTNWGSFKNSCPEFVNDTSSRYGRSRPVFVVDFSEYSQRFPAEN